VYKTGADNRETVSPANFLDWKRDASSFEAMGAADFWQANLTGVDTPERVMGLHVTANLLPMLVNPSMRISYCVASATVLNSSDVRRCMM
jgi:hypothetical protein